MKNNFFTKLILNYVKKFFYFFLDKKIDRFRIGNTVGEFNMNWLKFAYLKNFLSNKKVYIFLEQQNNYFLKQLVSKKDEKVTDNVSYFKDKYGYIFYRDLNIISSTSPTRYKLYDDDFAFWEKNSGLWHLLAFRKYDSWFFLLLSVYIIFELFLMIFFFNFVFGSGSFFDIFLFLKDNFLVFSEDNLALGKNRFYSFLLLYCLFWFFIELIFFFSDYIDEEEDDLEKFGETGSGSLFIHTQPYRSSLMYLFSSIYVLIFTFFFAFILMFIFYFFWIMFNVFLVPSLITFGIFLLHILKKWRGKLYKSASTRLSNYRRMKRRRFYHMGWRKFMMYQRMAQRPVVFPFLRSNNKNISNFDNTFKKIKKYHFLRNQADFMKSKRSLRDYAIPIRRKKIYLFSRSLLTLMKKDYLKNQKQRFLESREKIQFPRYKTFTIKNPIILNKLNFLKKFSYYYSMDRNYFGRIFSKMSNDMYHINTNRRSFKESSGESERIFAYRTFTDRPTIGSIKTGDIILNSLHIMDKLHEVLHMYYAYPLRNFGFKSYPYNLGAEYFFWNGKFDAHFRLHSVPYKLTTSTEDSGYHDFRDKDLFERYLSLFSFNNENLNKIFSQPTKSTRTFSNFENHYLSLLSFFKNERARFVKFHPEYNPYFNDFAWFVQESDKHFKGDSMLDDETNVHYLFDDEDLTNIYKTYLGKPGHDSRFIHYLSFDKGSDTSNFYFGLLDKNYTNKMFRQLRSKIILKRLLEEIPRPTSVSLDNFNFFLPQKFSWLMKRSLLLRNKHMEKFRRKGTLRKFLDEEETLRNYNYTSIGGTGLFNEFIDRDSLIFNRLIKSYKKDFYNFDMKFGEDSNRYRWNFIEFKIKSIPYIITKFFFNHYFQYQFPYTLLKKGLYNDRRRAHFLNFYKELNWDISRIIYKLSLGRVYEDDIPAVSPKYIRELRFSSASPSEFLLDLKKEGFRGDLSSLSRRQKMLLLNFLINKYDNEGIYTDFSENKNLLVKYLSDSLGGDGIDEKAFSYLSRHREFYYNIIPYLNNLFLEYKDEYGELLPSAKESFTIKGEEDEDLENHEIDKRNIDYSDFSKELDLFGENDFRNSRLLRYLLDQDFFLRNNFLKVPGGASFLKKYGDLKNLKIRPFYDLVNPFHLKDKSKLFFWERYRNLIFLENIFLEFFRKRKQFIFRKLENDKISSNIKELKRLNLDFSVKDDILFEDSEILVLNYFKFVFYFCRETRLSLDQYVFLIKKLIGSKSFFASIDEYFLYFRFLLFQIMKKDFDLDFCFSSFEEILYYEKILMSDKKLDIVAFSEYLLLNFQKEFSNFFRYGSGYLVETKFDRFRNYIKRYQKSRHVLVNEDHKLFSSLFSIFSNFSNSFNKSFYTEEDSNESYFSDSENVFREKYLYLLVKFFKENGFSFFLKNSHDFFKNLNGFLGFKSYNVLHYRKRKVLKSLYQKFLIWRKWKNFRSKKLNMNYIQSRKKILSKYSFLAHRIDKVRDMDLNIMSRFIPISFDLQTYGATLRNSRVGKRAESNLKYNFIFLKNRFLNQRHNGSPLVDVVKGQNYGGKRWRNFLIRKLVLGVGNPTDFSFDGRSLNTHKLMHKRLASFMIDKIIDHYERWFKNFYPFAGRNERWEWAWDLGSFLPDFFLIRWLVLGYDSWYNKELNDFFFRPVFYYRPRVRDKFRYLPAFITLRDKIFSDILYLSKLIRHPTKQTSWVRKKIYLKYKFLQRLPEEKQLEEALKLYLGMKNYSITNRIFSYFVNRYNLFRAFYRQFNAQTQDRLRWEKDTGLIDLFVKENQGKFYTFLDWLEANPNSDELRQDWGRYLYPRGVQALDIATDHLDDELIMLQEDTLDESLAFFSELFKNKSFFSTSSLSKKGLRYLSKNSDLLFAEEGLPYFRLSDFLKPRVWPDFRNLLLANGRDKYLFRKWLNDVTKSFFWDDELSYLKDSNSNSFSLKYPYFFFHFAKKDLLGKNYSLFFERRPLKNKRWLFLKNGRNLGFNFQKKISQYDQLSLKKDFFFNISEYIIKSVYLKSLMYNNDSKLGNNSFLQTQDLFNMLLRKYISFLYLNLLKKHSLIYKNGKLNDLFLFLKLNKMEKKIGKSYSFYEFLNLQKIRLPFYRFFYWLSRRQEFDDFLVNRLKKNRKFYINKDFFNVYYPSILTQKIFKHKKSITLKEQSLKSWVGWYYWLVRNFKNPLFSNYYMEFKNNNKIYSFLTNKQKKFVKDFLILRRHNLGYSFDKKLGKFSSKFWGEDYSYDQDHAWGNTRIFYRKVNQDMFYLSQYIDALLYIFKLKDLYSKDNFFVEKFSRQFLWDLNEKNKFLGGFFSIPDSSNFVDISLLEKLYKEFLSHYNKYSCGEFGDGKKHFFFEKEKPSKAEMEKRRRFFSFLLENVLFKYFETTFNVSKRDLVFLRSRFMLLKKFYKYNFILNDILENISINKNNVTSFQNFYLDWGNSNNFFFNKNKTKRFSLFYKYLFNNFLSKLYYDSSLSNFIYLKKKLRNVDSVLVNSTRDQLGVETMPRYVGKNLREKIYNWQKKDIFSNESNFINFLRKLNLKKKINLSDKLFLFRRVGYFPNRKFLEKKREYKINEVKNYSKFHESVKDPFSFYFRASNVDTKRKRYRKKFWTFGRNYAIDELKYNFFNKNRKFFSDRENIVFYSFLDKEYSKKFLWIFDKFGKKYANVVNNIRGEFPLQLIALRKNKNKFSDKFYFWRSIKLKHKLKTDKSFLNWIKRRYGDRLIKEFDKTAFLWKYNIFYDSPGNKFIPIAKAPVRGFLRRDIPGRKIFLDSKAAYANGKIRIPHGRLRDFYFLNRQQILRHLRKSLFAFKATTGFLFYSYNMRGWNDRLVSHVKEGDQNLFLDVVLEEEIIGKTNDILIPSFWFFRFPYSDVFSKFFNNSLFDFSLDLNNDAGVVMRMQTFLNNFNALNYNSLYPNGPLNALTSLSNFVDTLKYPYNAFLNFEKQFLEGGISSGGIYNNSLMTQEKIFDLLLAEKMRVVSYHKMLKYIKQYENLVFNRKVERFSSLECIFLQGDSSLKYSNYLNISSFLNRIEPFFFL